VKKSAGRSRDLEKKGAALAITFTEVHSNGKKKGERKRPGPEPVLFRETTTFSKERVNVKNRKK